jgi:NAD(P)-dependent dehydrogenase (short-subunit alcohol dehydrogenase family)
MNPTPLRTALVTGAARRIGRAIALDLARHGWSVAVHYHRSADEAREVAKLVEEAGGRAALVRADLAREEETDTLVSRAAESLGPLTCLVNNASTFELDQADTVTRASWDAHLETNLRAPFLLTQAFARQVPEGEPGNVINLLDQRVWNLTPFFVSYTVSKTALWTVTRQLALALAPRIRVNAIGPGPALQSLRQTEADFRRQCGMTPLGRGTTPEEICDAVRFILGAPALTGQMIVLDGGQHLGIRLPPGVSLPPE